MRGEGYSVVENLNAYDRCLLFGLIGVKQGEVRELT